MNSLLRTTLLLQLRAAFGDNLRTVTDESSDVAVFAAKHPEVGDIVVQEHREEATVYIGRFTHLHFDCYDTTLNASEIGQNISGQVVTFLQDMFADKIEVYGGSSGGGCRVRTTKPRGFWSKRMLGKQTYVWSGPVSADDA